MKSSLVERISLNNPLIQLMSNLLQLYQTVQLMINTKLLLSSLGSTASNVGLCK